MSAKFAASSPALYPYKSQDSVALPCGLKLEFDRDIPLDITNAIQYYFGLRTLMYAWSWAGSYVTRDYDGKDRCMAPLSVTQGYADESLRCCMEYGQGSLWWFQRNDQLTRGKVSSLVRRGYTIASALPEALHNTHLEWRSPSLSPVLQDDKPNKRAPKREAETPPAPPPKRERMVKSDAHQTISMLRGGKKICKPFNDGRGCKGGCQNAHVCDLRETLCQLLSQSVESSRRIGTAPPFTGGTCRWAFGHTSCSRSCHGGSFPSPVHYVQRAGSSAIFLVKVSSHSQHSFRHGGKVERSQTFDLEGQG